MYIYIYVYNPIKNPVLPRQIFRAMVRDHGWLGAHGPCRGLGSLVRMGFGAWGLGFRVWGLGFRVWGLGFRVWGLGFRVQCRHFAVTRLGLSTGSKKGLRFRVARVRGACRAALAHRGCYRGGRSLWEKGGEGCQMLLKAAFRQTVAIEIYDSWVLKLVRIFWLRLQETAHSRARGA